MWRKESGQAEIGNSTSDRSEDEGDFLLISDCRQPANPKSQFPSSQFDRGLVLICTLEPKALLQNSLGRSNTLVPPTPLGGFDAGDIFGGHLFALSLDPFDEDLLGGELLLEDAESLGGFVFDVEFLRCAVTAEDQFGLLGNKGIVPVHDGAAYLEAFDIGDTPFGVDGGEDPITLVEATPDQVVIDVVGFGWRHDDEDPVFFDDE